VGEREQTFARDTHMPCPQLPVYLQQNTLHSQFTPEAIVPLSNSKQVSKTYRRR